MKRLMGITMIVSMIAFGALPAKGKDDYKPCTIISMADVPCGSRQEIYGRKTAELLCQEYVIRSATTEYHIRQPKEKHAALLPVGAPAEFLIKKDELKLRVDGKEREFRVTSVSALSGAAN